MKMDQVWRKVVGASCLLTVAVCATRLSAQDQSPGVLPQRTPKTIEKPPGPPPVPEVPALATNMESEKIVTDKLTGVVIVASREEIKEEGVSDVTGVKVVNISLLSGSDFKKVVDPYLGRRATEGDIRRLENEIILYCRSKNRPLVDVILPPQISSSGVIQLWFLEGKIGKITVDNKGHKWFSDQFIKSQVRLRPMDTVDLKKLTEDLDWLNRNPFRQVNTVFSAGSALGQSDLTLQVDDRFPFRVYGGYENTGTKFTGQDRLLTGFNWGNVFGLDHQVNFQYTTDVDFSAIAAYAGSYMIPLPWRHDITFFGAYANTTATIPGNPGEEKGQSYQGSTRYSIPRPVSKSYTEEITFGFDFKRMNNNLEFGGVTVLGSGTDVDVDQFEAGYSGVLLDMLGQTSFGLEGYYSPGELTEFNNDTDYNELRPGSKANYAYGRLTADRLTKLPWNFSWVLHFFGQMANQRLTSSEEMGIGGFGTVRGYGERTYNGDDGAVVDNEIRTPPLHLGYLLPLKGQPDALQFLVFFDWGVAHIKDFSSVDLVSAPQATTALASWGAGLRYSLRNNLSVRFDYGFQLINREPDRHNGPDVGVLLSF